MRPAHEEPRLYRIETRHMWLTMRMTMQEEISYLVSTVGRSTDAVIRLDSILPVESSAANADSVDEISIVDILSVVAKGVLKGKRAKVQNHSTATPPILTLKLMKLERQVPWSLAYSGRKLSLGRHYRFRNNRSYGRVTPGHRPALVSPTKNRKQY